MMEKLLRFQEPQKLLPFLPGLSQATLAALFDLPEERYRQLLDGFTAQARWAATGLLEDAEFAAGIDRLPFLPGQHVLVIGESIAAERASWFEILRQALLTARGGDRINLTNLAVSGCTTTTALTQLTAVGFARPDWILCQLGGNDCRRLGAAGPRLVSPAEAERNLLLLRDLAVERTAASWCWVPMPRVDQTKVAAYPHFRSAGMFWSNEDIDRLADFLRTQAEPTAEVQSEVDKVTAPHNEDGLHLSLAGQQAVAAAVVKRLAA